MFLKKNIKLEIVSENDSGIRIDRWIKNYCPNICFSFVQKLLRSGKIKVDGRRVSNYTRLKKNQRVSIPIINLEKLYDHSNHYIFLYQKNKNLLQKMLIYEDKKIFIFNKPSGLAVQGGSGITHHIDGMLETLRNKKGEKPKLVHRIDRETSGILIVAKTRPAAKDLSYYFRCRNIQKLYWALVDGIPEKKEDIISTWLIKKKELNGEKIHVCNNIPDADYAISYYYVIDSSKYYNTSWVSIIPYTGRTHQIRVHMAHIGNPIIGDKKYSLTKKNIFQLDISKNLHLHARRIKIPCSQKEFIDITAPIPVHFKKYFNFLGFNEFLHEDTWNLGMEALKIYKNS